MEIRQVVGSLTQVYFNLVQAYEAEFSVLTEKLPDSNGLFQIDTPIDEQHLGYLAYENGRPVGFINILKVQNTFEVCEFYIVPAARKRKLGSSFMSKIWQMYPGHWQVKQIQGADHAINFWRNALTLNGIDYCESQYQDDYWGVVNRQIFTV
ncbi:GNAT family N-acetyltransferase [Pseudoalteromonas sp. Isolate6]|uniref:GNAT family N-acetyltransferase n=1 Tax=Pseudoalteromonas sp. Isolate6 TaxID=2908527 RepID=UPI001EFCDCC6|nr:GNAT family N-acetyltransferase [Pseudoalteromonas sp. Isolate6]MCG9760613.1 GNAT family N-acetyltransferase [Pseudoalteromonas sp. Isolate6]